MTGFSVSDQPENTQQDAQPAKKGFLARIFNKASMTNMAAGIVVGATVKVGALALFGSAVTAIAAGAAAVGVTSTAVKRAFDIHEYNKSHQDNKASYLRDFFNAAKTGHKGTSYITHLGVASGFALAGGMIGFAVADILGGGNAPAGGHTVDPAPIIEVPEIPELDAPAVTIEQPSVEQPVAEDAQQIADNNNTAETTVDEPAVEDVAAEDVAAEEPAVEEPAVDVADNVANDNVADNAAENVAESTTETVTADDVANDNTATENVVTVEASLDERMAALLAEAQAALPADPSRKVAEALTRLTSSSDLVQAQAIKDLGFFFANGFNGVTENDVLATKLFELAIEVSDGKNMQAVHDLGYQLLHGFGAEQDTARAYELLSTAKEGGHKLSGGILNYMNKAGLAPAIS